MIHERIICLTILGSLTLFGAVPALAEERILRDDWFALYIMGNKLGWNHERVVEKTADGRIVLLFAKRIVELDPAGLTPRVVAEVPEGINAGVAVAGGHVYFCRQDRLMSCPLPVRQAESAGSAPVHRFR